LRAVVVIRRRFLKLKILSIPIIWFPIIEAVINLKFKLGERPYLAIDRTQWQDKNLFLVAVIIDRRAFPVYWQFLVHRGASNLVEQKALLRPVFKLLKKYELVVLGDRELQACGTSSLADREESILCFPSKKRYLNQIHSYSLINS
jgi:hypothetical protein